MGAHPRAGRVRKGADPWRWVLVVVAVALLNGLPVAGTAAGSAGSTPVAPSIALPASDAAVGVGGDLVGDGPPVATSVSTWSNITPSSNPGARTQSAAAYDPSMGGLILFGGQAANGSALGDTWRLGGASWMYLAPVDGRTPSPRWGAAMAYDSAAGTLLLFGGQNETTLLSDTWTFNLSGWHRLAEVTGPSARAFAAIAYDPGLSGVVLFGGRAQGTDSTVSNETWLFVARAWVDLTPRLVGTAPGRYSAVAAYDAADGNLLLFGGTDSPSGDRAAGGLWRLDAVGWTNLSIAGVAGPSSRIAPAFAYDAASASVLLFGGAEWSPVGAASFPTDTWSFRQGLWTNLTGGLTTYPPGREAAIGASAPALGGFVLIGGDGGAPSAARSDMWRFSAEALSVSVTATPTAGPAPLNVTFTLEASGGSGPYSVTWVFGDSTTSREVVTVHHVYGLPGNYLATVTVGDGAGDTSVQSIPIAVLTAWQGAHQWANVGAPGASAPGPRSAAQIAYDPALQSVILFGGDAGGGAPSADTWEFVNNVWIDLTAGLARAPPARFGGALTYDSVDATLVLFGGSTGASVLNDTWTFDGTAWTQLPSAVAPSPRAFAQMTYDPSDGYVVLFGGGSAPNAGVATSVSSDTWEFRGGAWVNVTSQLSIAPPPTTGGTFSWDPQDSVLVLNGGSSIAASGAPGTCYPDAMTWTFGGGAWSSQVAGSPTPRLFGMAAYDSTDHVVLLYGGSESHGNSCAVSADSWSYIGGGWSNLSGTIPFPPAARDRGGMAFDAAEGVVVLFGGSASGVPLNDTWIYPSQLNGSATTTTTNTSGNGSTSAGPPPGGSTGPGTPGSGNGNPPIAPFAVGYSLSSVASTGPLTVTFMATAVGGVPPFTFVWNFGDSTLSGNGSTVSHRYTVAGTFVPVLTASDARGEIVVAVLASIHVAPGAPGGIGVVSPVTVAGPTMAEWSIAGLAAGAVVLSAVVFAFRRQERRQEQEEVDRGTTVE